jgi:hypothetical protein
MACLIDTNIFVRLAKQGDPQRSVALTAITRLRSTSGVSLYSTSQILTEFWNVKGPNY